MPGLKDSDSNSIIININHIKHENGPVVWSGPYIMCCNYQQENISNNIKVKASSFEWCIVCLSRMSLNKVTR